MPFPARKGRLPARYPNLLVNGTTGIAVGMATNIPPHNLTEVINAVVRIIDNKIEEKESTIDEMLDIIKGPDFPTGAHILGLRGIREAYTTGRGKIRVRAVSEIEAMPNGKNRIIVTELPYLVNKAKLIEILTRLDFLKAFTAIRTVLVDEIGLLEAEFPYTLTKKDYKRKKYILNVVYKRGNFGKYGRTTKVRSGIKYYIEQTNIKLSHYYHLFNLSRKENIALITKREFDIRKLF